MPTPDGLRGRHAERDVLDGIVQAVRAGKSRALVVRGEPGAGKTALLEYLIAGADGCRVARISGVQSEMELAFAGLHQLCGPMMDRVERLPPPQRGALRIAFGLSGGTAPDRFLLGLAVLGLLSETADEHPLVCVVDDEQWLDRASAQVLAFVGRRLMAEPVALVFATRVLSEELVGLPELVVEGLADDDARALLESAFNGPLDPRVRDQILAEAHGNPLALLELPRGLTLEQLAGGFGLPTVRPLAGRIEESFRRQLDALPAPTRRLLELAAADPSGDPLLVWRAAGQLRIPVQAATPAVEAGLVEFGARVVFRHPLVRSAAYRSASLTERQASHRALAEATDPRVDPDRRAWHHAHAALGPDEEVATELDGSASRARARGGYAAAAAFLERAALLTAEPSRRTQRLLAAAEAKYLVSGLDTALGLLVSAEAGPLDTRQAAEVERLRGQIARLQRRGGESSRLLLSAAKLFEPVDPNLARETLLEAIGQAMWTGGAARDAAAVAARAASVSPNPPRPVDVLLDAFALLLTDSYPAAASALLTASDLVLALPAPSGEAGREVFLVWQRASQILAHLGDTEAWHALAVRQVEAARDAGAPHDLQAATGFLTLSHLHNGELAAAARLIEEDRLISEATRTPLNLFPAVLLAAWRGQEASASEVIEAARRAGTIWELASLTNAAFYASSVLYNGLGRHDDALDSARRAFELDPVGYGPFLVPELAEAASRTGEVRLLQTTREWLSERIRVAPTDWLLGMEALVLALLSDGETAEPCFRESIEQLGKTRVRSQLARTHLLYGEWLRRCGRRTDARGQLHTAYEMFDAMGMTAFAERARRELLATGKTVRKRTVQTAPNGSGALTAQEAVVARLARDGLSNPQIGARLFLSTRTVQYHLSKVFTKLGISSRGQLHSVLADDSDAIRPR